VDVRERFKSVDSVLVIDWPSKDVPESLARAGFNVVVRGGPRPEDYSAYAMSNGAVVTRHVGRAQERADVIYAHRPLSELPGIIATAKSLDAAIIWTQSGFSAAGVRDPEGCWVAEDELRVARELVESVGLSYVSEPYIGDVAREIRAAQ